MKSRSIINIMKTIAISIIVILFSCITALADVNPDQLEGVLNGLVTQQQINESNKPQLADRYNSNEIIDPVTGTLTLKETDLKLPGKDGLDLTIGRIYNSSQAGFDTPKAKVSTVTETTTTTEEKWQVHVKVYDSNTNYSGEFDCLFDDEENAYIKFYYFCNYFGDDYSYIPSRPKLVTIDVIHTTKETKISSYLQKYNYERSRYDLGAGWSLAFPSLQIEREHSTDYLYFHDGSGSVYRVDFKNDTNGTNLVDYQGKDVEFLKDDGSYTNGQDNSKYKFVESDKRISYFSSDGRLLGIFDRFGNQIKFTYIDRTIYTNTQSYPDHVKSTNFEFIDQIVDSVGRTVKFTYDNNVNSPNDFTGDKITIQVFDPTNTNNLSIVYKKNRILVSSNDDEGQVVDNYYEPYLESVTRPDGVVTKYLLYEDPNKDPSVTWPNEGLKFKYQKKDLKSAIKYLPNLIGGVLYANTETFYNYEKTVRNLGNDGASESFRIKERYDKQLSYNEATGNRELSGDINHVNYTYGGDYTGYPDYESDKKIPSTYEFWSQSQSCDGQIEKNVFNKKMQQIRTETTVNNGEKKIQTNVAFSSNFKYQPTKIQLDEYTKDGILANTLFTVRTYNDWGGVQTETQPLTLVQLNDQTLKQKYTTTYLYTDSTYKYFITEKQWYQDDSKRLKESYLYDNLGRMKTQTNANGETTNYTYSNDLNDPNIRIVEISQNLEDGSIAKTVIIYGAGSNYAYPTKIEEYYTDNTGSYTKSTTTKKYDMILGLVQSETDNSGNTTSYTYDNMGRVLTSTLPDFTNSDNETYSVVRYYDYYFGFDLQKLKEEFVKHYSYLNDQLKDYTDSSNKWLSSNAVYSVTCYTDSKGGVKYYESTVSIYDGYGNLRQEEAYDYYNGAAQWIIKERYTYDNQERTVSTTDAENNTNTYSYDGWGRITENIDPFGNLYKTDYDINVLRQAKLQ